MGLRGGADEGKNSSQNVLEPVPRFVAERLGISKTNHINQGKTMKRMKLLACLLALATVAGAWQAMAAPGFGLGVGVQYWDAKDADVFDENGFWGANLILRLRPADYVGIDFRAGGSGVWDGDTYRRDGTKYRTDATFMCCPFEVGLVLMLPVNDGITLYAGPGVGYYYYDIDLEVHEKHGHHYHSEWSDHIKMDDDFGWYAVAGLNLHLGPNFGLFGEVRYTETETSLKHSDSRKIDCSGIGGQAGIMIEF